MLELNEIEFTFNKHTSLAQKILKGINLEVKEGEFVVLLGGNGAGKSTLLNILSGFLSADCGTIMLNKQDITKLLQHKKSKAISIVMQDPKISTMEHMSILENLAFAYSRSKKRTLMPFSNAFRKKLFKERLSRLNMGLENRLDDLVSALSGGQRQALSLCMALLSDCKLLLLDEICAALDPNAAEMIMYLTSKIVKEQKLTTIMITHNMDHALRFADKIVILANGKVQLEFSKQDKANLTQEILAKAMA